MTFKPYMGFGFSEPPTAEQYIARGFTKAGARAMVERDAGRPDPQVGPPSLSVESTRPLGGLPTERAEQPFITNLDGRYTLYEISMVHASHHPHARVLGETTGETIAHMKHREDLLDTFSPLANRRHRTFYGEIKARYKDGEISPLDDGYAYCSDDPKQLDLTRCGFSNEVYLDIAQERGDYSPAIAELLAEREQQTRGEPAVDAIPEAASTASLDPMTDETATIERLAEWIFRQHLHPSLSYKSLRAAALKDTQLGAFKWKDFLAAYNQKVYHTKPVRRPANGWPLRPEYRTRSKAEKSSE